MSWRDELRRVTLSDGKRLIGASFRGVPFFVEGTDRSGGRRVVVHEFPKRDDPFIEDMGRRGRVFHVDGYVLGDDYVEQRDALLEALEDTEGPGELVHPSHGVRRAICSGLSTRETKADGGMAVFSLEFTETPAQAVQPSVEPDLSGTVTASADVAVAATQADLVAAYDPAGLPSFALASAERAVTAMAGRLRQTLGPVIRDAQELAALDGDLHVLIVEVSSLVRQPTAILGAFINAISGLEATVVSAPGAVIGALLDAYDVDLGPPASELTATRARERANQIALEGALRQVMVIQAARIAPQAKFESLEEATALRDGIIDRLEEQAATATDTTYPSLVSLRADVARAVPGDAEIARVITISRRVAIPSLLLSYQLYGSVAQELDLVARNRIRHPGFVAGDNIKALSNV